MKRALLTIIGALLIGIYSYYLGIGVKAAEHHATISRFEEIADKAYQNVIEMREIVTRNELQKLSYGLKACVANTENYMLRFVYYPSLEDYNRVLDKLSLCVFILENNQHLIKDNQEDELIGEFGLFLREYSELLNDILRTRIVILTQKDRSVEAIEPIAEELGGLINESKKYSIRLDLLLELLNYYVTTLSKDN